jgi:hypothetical protein
MSNSRRTTIPGRDVKMRRMTQPAAQVAEENVERHGEQLMTKQEIEALGQAMLREHGLPEWTVRAVYEQDDMGDEDDIAGRYGRAFHEERLSGLTCATPRPDARARNPAARDCPRSARPTGGRSARGGIRFKLRVIGGGLFDATGVRS